MKRLVAGILILIAYSYFWIWLIVTRWGLSWSTMIHSFRLYITIPEIIVIYSIAILLIIFGVKAIKYKRV